MLEGKGYFTPAGMVWISNAQKDRDVVPAGAYAVVGGYLAMQYPSGPRWRFNPGELPVPIKQPVQVVQGRTYFTRTGIVHTIDVDGPPPDGAYAFRNRTGERQKDGTITWNDSGPVVGIQQPSQDPGCGQCEAQKERVPRIDPDFEHWRCEQCGFGWKVRDDTLQKEIVTQNTDAELPVGEVTPITPKQEPTGVPKCPGCGLRRNVTERLTDRHDSAFVAWTCKPCNIIWKTRRPEEMPPPATDVVAWKTDAGIPVTDAELEAAMAEVTRAQRQREREERLARYYRAHAAMLYTTVALCVLSLVFVLLFIWSPIFATEFLLTGQLTGATAIGLSYYRAKHHHRPVKPRALR